MAIEINNAYEKPENNDAELTEVILSANSEEINNAVNTSPSINEANNQILSQEIEEFSKTQKEMLNMEKIYTFALGKNISPYSVLAYTYNENIQNNTLNQAKESDISKNKETKVNISGKDKVVKAFEQKGQIKNEKITGAVLDFTGSMKKGQIQSILTTLQELFDQGIVDQDTQISVMYDIANQDNKTKNGEKTFDKLQDTDKKIQSISFKDLKKYLLDKGLVDQQGNVKVETGIGSTPLYSAILKNLMNSTVRETTIFTDGASDASAVEGIGEEESGNKQAWDAMIHLCKTYNKKIRIVGFNMNPKYIERTQNMINYFKEKGMGEFITILNLGKIKDEDLASKLKNSIQESNITIKEDPKLFDKKLTAVNGAQTTPSDQLPIVNNDGQTVFYDAQNKSYQINFSKIFPSVNIADYDVDYTINSYAQIEKNDLYEKSDFQKNTFVLDLSSSMKQIPQDAMKSKNFYVHPGVSYEELKNMQNSIRGFSEKNIIKDNTQTTEVDISTIPSRNLSLDINFGNPNKFLYGLILKQRIQNTTNQQTKQLIEKELVAIYNGNIPKINSSYLQELTENQKNEIAGIYKYVASLENVASDGITPILGVVSRFSDTGFSTNYKDKKINFLTDFGHNSTGGWLGALKEKQSFEGDAEVIKFQRNLLEKNITINFMFNKSWPDFSKNDYEFLLKFGNFVNQQSGKKLINFQEIALQDQNNIFLQPKGSEYKRHSMALTLKHKKNNTIIQKTLAIDEV